MDIVVYWAANQLLVAMVAAVMSENDTTKQQLARILEKMKKIPTLYCAVMIELLPGIRQIKRRNMAPQYHY